jgi:hypothetical protein
VAPRSLARSVIESFGSMKSQHSSGVEFAWGLTRERAWGRARCPDCDRIALRDVRVGQIVGFSGDVGRDAQARAMLTRSLLAALREDRCTHAAHDRAALADCILRPDRARLAGVLAALLDADEREIEAVLRAPSLVARWMAEGLDLSWKCSDTPMIEPRAWCQARGGVAKAAVVMAADEAWELLASRGFVAIEWLGDEGRGFRTHIEQGIVRAELPEYVSRWRARGGEKPARSKGADGLYGAPQTLRACVALAADREGLEAAEVLVREVVTRLAPWGVAPVRTVSWRTVDAARWRTERQSWWSEPLRSTIASVLKSMHFTLPPGYGPTDPPPRPSWWSLAAAEGSLAKLWDELRAEGVARADGVDSSLLRDFSALPNPYEPLLSIWSTGFVFDELKGDEAVLVASEW